MLKGIDVSYAQGDLGFLPSSVNPEFCFIKATEATCIVDDSCDRMVQDCIAHDIPFGFYHFASGDADGATQARYFRKNTKEYEGKGIPILDFEVKYPNSFIDDFVKEYHAITGVFPLVYMNASFVNDEGYGSDFVRQNCGLWLAGYPRTYTEYPGSDCPYRHDGWTLAAWQFTNCLAMDGMQIDGDFFYGDRKAWNAYAGTDGTGDSSDGMVPGLTLLELATDVIKGRYGNGADRRAALGSRYDEVQAKINDLYAEANNVIKGRYGNGTDRRNALGDEYGIVQYIVNNMLK